MLIDGELVEGRAGRAFDNINPATEEVLGRSPTRRRGHGARHRRGPPAPSTTPTGRPTTRSASAASSSCRRRSRASRRSSAHELVAEVGCPMSSPTARSSTRRSETRSLWPAEMIDHFEWSATCPTATRSAAPAGARSWKEAAGVVGAIVPWNYPFEIILNKLGQALATGNTWSSSRLPTRRGTPPASAGSSPSRPTSRRASSTSSTSSDHLVGEVLVDRPAASTSSRSRARPPPAAHHGGGRADDEARCSSSSAASRPTSSSTTPTSRPRSAMASSSVCMHGGQGCAMPTRLLVPRPATTRPSRSPTPRFETSPTATRPTPATSRARRSAPSSASACSATSRRARQEGARLVAGGGRPAHLDKGYFVEPTLFADVDNSMTIAQEEIFGPVLS